MFSLVGARHASVFLAKCVLCQTFSLGVIQMHVLVSLGVVYPFRNSV